MEVRRSCVYRFINHADGGNVGVVPVRILCEDDQREIRDELASCCSHYCGHFNGEYYMGIAGDGEISQMAITAGTFPGREGARYFLICGRTVNFSL